MIKKLNTAGIKVAAPSKSKKDKPTFRSADLQPQVDELVKLLEEKQATEGSIAVIKGAIRTAVFPAWVEANKGLEAVSTLRVVGSDVEEGSPVSVDFSFTEGYKSTIDHAALVSLSKIMGESIFESNFRQKITIGIDMDTVPDIKAPEERVVMVLSVEEAQWLANNLIELQADQVKFNELRVLSDAEYALQRLPETAKQLELAVDLASSIQTVAELAVGLAEFDNDASLAQTAINNITHVTKALGLSDDFMTVKELILPIKGFNKFRATNLTLEQNIAIDEIIATPDSMKKGA